MYKVTYDVFIQYSHCCYCHGVPQVALIKLYRYGNEIRLRS